MVVCRDACVSNFHGGTVSHFAGNVDQKSGPLQSEDLRRFSVWSIYCDLWTSLFKVARHRQCLPTNIVSPRRARSRARKGLAFPLIIERPWLRTAAKWGRRVFYGHSKGFHDALSKLLSAQDEEDVWQSVSSYLEELQISQFNYGYLDTFNHPVETAPLALKSTMDPGWIEYYFERGYDQVDHIMDEYRRGRRTPILSGPNLQEYVPELSGEARNEFGDAAQAGLLAAASIPLPAPMSGDMEVTGICLVSQLTGSDFLKTFSENGLEIMLFINAMHDKMLAPLIQRTIADPSLTARERDCLALAAMGYRPDAIGDHLHIATVTANVHLRRARMKLKSKTLPEAVARAIRFGVVQL